MQASGVTEFIPFICTSAIFGQPCFLVHLKEWQMAISCIPLAPQQSLWRVRGNSIHCVTVLGAVIHIWRPEIADGCDISWLLIWQEIFSFHRLDTVFLKGDPTGFWTEIIRGCVGSSTLEDTWPPWPFLTQDLPLRFFYTQPPSTFPVVSKDEVLPH